MYTELKTTDIKHKTTKPWHKTINTANKLPIENINKL